jgi:hypothetical protein
MHKPLKFILKWISSCFGQFIYPSSGVMHCIHSNGIWHQTCMTYTTAVFKMQNSWWWTEELSETRRISFQNKFENLVHLAGFITGILWVNPSNYVTLKSNLLVLSCVIESVSQSACTIAGRPLFWICSSSSIACIFPRLNQTLQLHAFNGRIIKFQ